MGEARDHGRIWDRFLTDRDKRHIATVPRPEPRGIGARPCLLLVDNYRAVLGDHPQELLEAIKDWPMSTGLEGWRAVERIQVLLERVREVGWPVVHVTGLHRSESGLPGWYEGRGAALDDPPPDEPTNGATATDTGGVGAGDYEIIDQLKPAPGEVVLKKAGPSAFGGTPLAGYLNSLGVDTLVVCGETTSGCIRSTVMEGRGTYRFHIVVPEECVYDRHEASHAVSLFDMNEKYADVVPVDDVLSHLEGG